MPPSADQEVSATVSQFWSQFLLPYELICIGASFGTLSTLMAIEVWKITFGMLSPRSPYDWLDLPDDARKAVTEALQSHAITL
jgi:hypothetical protein